MLRTPSHRLLALLLSLTAAALPLMAQEPDESKVQLISAQSAQLLEKDGQDFRKVVGPAKFYHNKTYLLCDTALWNVSTNIIDAVGNVRIIQDQTTLSSETLQYVVDEDMAKFRGSLVQLEDKDNNILRTRYLDYNTKDSVAIFQDGAAMRDKDGQIIESLYGTYDSKAHLFVFNDQVNMYMDTTFVKTSRLEYRSDLSTAYFGFATDMWQDDKMLSANDGWYDRSQELFMFRRQVHLLTKDQETWSDTLYYDRVKKDVEMFGNVELMDTTRNVFALAGHFEYSDTLQQIRMTREPAIMSIDEDKEKQRDTLYIGADVLLYRTIKKCDIPESVESDAQKRLSDISGDPVMEYRKKAAEAAAKAAEEAAMNDPNRPPVPPKPIQQSAPAPEDEEAPASEEEMAPADSLAPAPEPVEPPKDTTPVSFLYGSKNVKLFRRDIQMSSDSLTYTDLDSLVRLYQDPIFFNEGNRQYASDSIYMVIRDKKMQKAHLLSNAFITIQEDPVSFDQIRGAEMVAYFDSTTALTRFDALGGAASLFYIEEQEVLATVNKVETKMIYATFKDGNIERMYYYDNPKNDGYPTVQLSQDDKQLKGYRWEPERRPASPLDVTSLVPRPSERTSYLARPHAVFKQTNEYFPGYINQVYRDIAIRDSLQVVRQREEQRRKELEAAAADSLAIVTKDSLLVTPAVDSLAVMPAADTLVAAVDSLAAVPVVVDSLGTAVADSLATVPPKELSAKELRAQEKAREKALKQAEKERIRAEKERIRAEKEAEREVQWAEEERLERERQEAKRLQKLEKERARKLKALRKREKKAQKERAIFEKYLEREMKKKNKKQKLAI